MRGGALLLGISCLLLAGPAVAGALYRCAGPDGVTSYVSKRVPGARCTVISQYQPSQAKAARPPVTTAVPPASGSASPAHAVAGSPVAGSVPAKVNSPAPVAAAQGKPPSRLVQGQVYSYIKDGVRHYTSKRPNGLANASSVRTIRYRYMETCYACAARPGVDFGRIRLNTAAYNTEIAAAARDYGVEEAVVRAIIHAESAFNPNALSRVGAQGLMQLMPATARRFGVDNAFDAAQNIRGGVQYLSWLLKRFNGNLTLAAAGYNAGEGAVDKYKGVPPYSETQRYVQRVAVLADRYRGSAPVVR